MMELDLDKLRAVRVLGRGAMGTVFLVADRSSAGVSSPALFALKVVEKNSPTAKPDADRRARWEVSVLSQLSHPFLPSLLGSVETAEFIAWAVPFFPGGDLNALRHALPDRVFSTTAIRFYVSEVVAALAHLHSLGIVYRDLKPENLLLRADGHLVLSDFDLSRHLVPKPPPPPNLHDALPPKVTAPSDRRRRGHRRNLTRILFHNSGHAAARVAGDVALKKAKSARVSPVSRRRPSDSSGSSGSSSGGCERSYSFVGTEEYVSPEVVRGDGHEFAVDWWALGVLTYEMAYGRTPFRGRSRKETFRSVLHRQPEFPGRHRSDLTDLIGRLLAKDPARRLGSNGGAEELKAHHFFKGVQWDLLSDVSRPPYLTPLEDLEEDDSAAAAEGFDVRDYFKKLRQERAAVAAGSPLASPASFTEF